MLEYAIISYLKIILLIIPVWFSGIVIVRTIIKYLRVELILPTGLIMGISIYVFLLNGISYIFPPPQSIYISYLTLFFTGLALNRIHRFEKLDLVYGWLLLFWIFSIIFWAVFLIWKSNFALIGSDTNLYYSIASNFIKGNFPPQTPWQPDLPLSYHVGASELLGAFHFLTGLDFTFLHIFFSFLFIFCSSQIIIWILKRHESLITFLQANLAVAAAFISFGFFFITWPVFSLKMPEFKSLNQLVLWLRDLPTVNNSIEVYGAPINLDGLIYFIFHAFGLAIFLSLIAVVLHIKKDNWGGWLIICIGLASLALVSESIFIAAFPALVLGMLLVEHKEGTLSKNLKKILTLLSLTFLVILYQGGIISASIIPSSNVESSVVLFPKKEDVKEDFTSYHLGQQSSKLLPAKTEWLPFRWFHVGIDLLLPISLLVILFLKLDFRQSLLLKMLFIAALASLGAYHIIVPKFLVANGNRFLSVSFLFFSLLLSFAFIYIWEKISKDFIKRVLFLILVMWIFVPTILPSLASLSKTRFGENKLIPKKLAGSPAILWLKNNSNFSERVMVLDKNAPHPSGQVRALIEAGIFAPVFNGTVRAFTIEASPEYIDIAYALSPKALGKFKISTLLIDSDFYQTLPEKRQNKLDDEKYFKKIFDYSNNLPAGQAGRNKWEGIYKIQGEYLRNGGELDGTLGELLSILPKKGKIYIDNEESFKYDFLRRPIIFMLRDRDLYYLPQSGVYLNVEAYINQKTPDKNIIYDYLVLGDKTDPENVCKCRVKLIWKGLNNQVFLWRSEYFGKVEK